MSNKGKFSSILSIHNKLLVLQIILLGSILAGSGYSIYSLNNVDTGSADNIINTMIINVNIADV